MIRMLSNVMMVKTTLNQRMSSDVLQVKVVLTPHNSAAATSQTTISYKFSISADHSH